MPAKPTSEEVWRAVLQGKIPGLRQARQLFRLLPAERRCKNCHAPLSGPGAVLMHLIGRHAYKKNPHFCNQCMWLGQVYPGGAEIQLSLFFTDVRGSTTLAENITAVEFSQLMNKFYEVATDVLIRSDAFIDKLVGDEVIGLYLPGYAGADHARKAVQAAQELLHVVGYGTSNGPWLPIGIGVHTGLAYVGTVQGSAGTVADFTALGDSVNVTARLASKAGPGEALLSDAVYTESGMSLENLERRQLKVKGKSEPIGVHVLRALSR